MVLRNNLYISIAYNEQIRQSDEICASAEVIREGVDEGWPKRITEVVASPHNPTVSCLGRRLLRYQ